MSNIKEIAKNLAATCIDIPGKEVEILGCIFTCAPLSLGSMKKHVKRIAAFAVDAKPDLEFMMQIIFLSLKRNYPDLTPELLDEMVDTANLGRVFLVALEVNAEEAKSGEM